MTAFTCGMDDLRLTDEGNTWRKDILKQSVDIGRVAATEVTNLDEDTKNNNKELLRRLEEILRDDNKLGILDALTQSKVNAITSQVVSKCVPDGTMKRFLTILCKRWHYLVLKVLMLMFHKLCVF